MGDSDLGFREVDSRKSNGKELIEKS